MKNPFRRPPRDRGAPSLRPTTPASAEKPMPEYRPVKKPAGKTAASSDDDAPTQGIVPITARHRHRNLAALHSGRPHYQPA